jgi:hypothetical protein
LVAITAHIHEREDTEPNNTLALGRVRGCRRDGSARRCITVARRWAIPSALVVALLMPVVTTQPAPAQQATPPTTLTFNYTGNAQSWTVPADVHQATFDVFGAHGGNRPPLFTGGSGGRATATIAVTPGETFVIMVGGQGLNNSPPTADCVLITGSGGFNGGGSGGDVNSADCSGPGGGGASDVRRGGSALTNRVLVAGGGGGAAANLVCTHAGGGGGLFGENAAQNIVCFDGSGEGGNQDGSTGSGQLGQGGQGADDAVFASAGGGGGGGYYGGGGGNAGLGGGGGSGFGPADTAFQTDVRQGNGVVTVAFGAAPTVTGVSPNFGPDRGFFDSVITGTNFVPGQTSVMFGPTPSSDVECVSTTQCQAASPPGSGTVSVRVTANGQQSVDTPADDYTYLGVPTITSISPTAGPQGTVVTIHGTNFFTPPFTNFVQFGPNTFAQPVCTSFTECTVTSPAGVGTVDLVLGTQSGPSNGVPFTMTPGVTRLTPTSGPAAGNTAVTITGTGFNTAPGATTVHFGSAAALAVGCANVTTCTAVSPPGSGTVAVRVTVAGVQSPDTPADDFAYVAGEGEPPGDPADDLAALEAALRATGPVGRGLAALVDRAGDAVEDGRRGTACALLRTFAVVVRVLGAVGSLPADQSTQLATEAARIRGTLSCR